MYGLIERQLSAQGESDKPSNTGCTSPNEKGERLRLLSSDCFVSEKYPKNDRYRFDYGHKTSVMIVTRPRGPMAKMGLLLIYQRPQTSEPHPSHRIYPYLQRKLEIERAYHVSCADTSP